MLYRFVYFLKKWLVLIFFDKKGLTHKKCLNRIKSFNKMFLLNSLKSYQLIFTWKMPTLLRFIIKIVYSVLFNHEWLFIICCKRRYRIKRFICIHIRTRLFCDQTLDFYKFQKHHFKHHPKKGVFKFPQIQLYSSLYPSAIWKYFCDQWSRGRDFLRVWSNLKLLTI